MTIEGPLTGLEGPCERILRTLPRWFGDEASLLAYARATAHQPTFVVSRAGQAVGFLSLQAHFPASWEVTCIAVDAEHRGQGLGKRLHEHAEQWLVGQGAGLLQVKTLAASHRSSEYAQTRAFYRALGYTPVEVFPTLWAAHLPVLQLVKVLPCAGAKSPKYALPEIERRWLVPADRRPDLSAARRRAIEDKYLQGGRLRLRAISAELSETVFKLGKKYPRVGNEVEQVVSVYLSKAEYELLHALPGAAARKTRYTVDGGVLDVYDHPPGCPSIFEVEFRHAADAAAYSPPQFVGEEVTGNARYTGHALAQCVTGR